MPIAAVLVWRKLSQSSCGNIIMPRQCHVAHDDGLLAFLSQLRKVLSGHLADRLLHGQADGTYPACWMLVLYVKPVKVALGGVDGHGLLQCQIKTTQRPKHQASGPTSDTPVSVCRRAKATSLRAQRSHAPVGTIRRQRCRHNEFFQTELKLPRDPFPR